MTPTAKPSPSARTAGFWDRIADEYAQKPIANPQAYERKLEATRARLRPSDTLLDIGCGTGSLALELAPLVSEVVAIDLSREMVRIARSKAEAANATNVTFTHTSIERATDFRPEGFDVITAYNLLHLVDDLDDTIAKIFGLLKPGGTFVSSTSCLRESWVPFGLILPVMRWLGKAPHVLPLRAEAVLGGLRRVGFVQIERHTVTKDRANVFVLATKPGS